MDWNAMSNEAEIKDLFTVYYMNHSKVYEMRMLLNNKIWKEATSEEDKAASGNAELHVKEKERSRSFRSFLGTWTQTWDTRNEQS